MLTKPHTSWLAIVLLIVLSINAWSFFWSILETTLVPQKLMHVPKQRVETEVQYSINALPSWDSTRLINISEFQFLLSNTVCDDRPLDVLILVHSAPTNFDKRKGIRETWGTPRNDTKLLFLIGAVDTQNLQDRLDDEDSHHHDLIQGNFKDAYRNLTYKHVMAFKYTVYYCPTAKYVLKTDDDTFVNINAFMDFVKKLPPDKKDYILCSLMTGAPAVRWPSKWKVDFREFPHSKYPVYCAGFAILYSYDVVFRLYREAQRGEYFWVDDAHVTGVLAKRINLRHTGISNVYMYATEMEKYLQGTGKFITKPFFFGPINLNPERMRRLWDSVQQKIKINHTSQNPFYPYLNRF